MKRGTGMAGRAGSVRCAIYTRKSSDEGLEQDFNSLDAQREACAAYVLSQASEGWYDIGTRYDDGGISGGTLERPALQRLLADVAAGQIDIIVVYKVDRLTRSLLDFAKLVETFDHADASFVSITQSFNTTTSMGRLTLNMLLSFAQFEREVTAERIRDKIAASKAKGMWMGGTPPLGYRPDGRSLTIVEEHATIIREVFRRYLDLGNVRLVTDSLERDRIHAPLRTRIGSGKPYGGVVFTRGQVHAFLKCATYVGEIHHQGNVYTALHPPIVDRATWDAVQAKLAEHVQGERRAPRAATTSLLAGRIVDTNGEPLLATHAVKGKARYRYYVSRALHHRERDTGLRIPAREIETLVANRVAVLFDDPIELVATAWLQIPHERYPALTNRCAELAAQQRQRVATALTVVDQVVVGDTGIVITCRTDAIAALVDAVQDGDAPSTIELVHDAHLTRTGRALRLVHDDGSTPAPTVDRSLVQLIIRARRWWATLREGEVDITRLAEREGVSAAYITRVVRLAFLSPKVVNAILAGRQLASVDAKRLTLDTPLAPLWQDQHEALLPS